MFPRQRQLMVPFLSALPPPNNIHPRPDLQEQLDGVNRYDIDLITW